MKRQHHFFLFLIIIPALFLLGNRCGSDVKGLPNNLIQASPQSLSFIARSVGETETQKVILQHIGDEGTVVIDEISVEATKNGEITVTQPDKKELLPGEKTVFEVTYKSVDAKANSGVIKVKTNARNAEDGFYEIPFQVVEQAGVLKFFPASVDFGNVPQGESKQETITVKYEGAEEIEITEISIKQGSSPDFKIVNAPDPLPKLKNQDTFEITVEYTPQNGDTDQGLLSVKWNGENEETVTLRGAEIAPKILIVPGKIDFGNIEMGVEYTKEATIFNKGGYALKISNISLQKVAPDVDINDFWLEGIETGKSYTIESGEKLPFVVHLKVTKYFAQTPFPVAKLVFESNSAETPVLDLQIFARISSPELAVSPEGVVDFGFVALNFSQERTLTVLNKGTGDLIVKSITITDDSGGEFEIIPDDSFPPLSSNPQEGTISPGQHVDVKLKFTNKQSISGTAYGKLTIESNDPVFPSYTVDLKAERTKSKVCKLSFAPPTLNFSIVPHGQYKDMVMNVVNIGSGECTFSSAKINDCSSFGGMFTGCQESNFPSSYFKILSLPAPIQDGLKPGEKWSFKIRFTPPPSAPLLGFEDYNALLVVKYKEPFSNPGTYTEHSLPDNCQQSGGFGGGCQPNILAKSGISAISVLPDHLDFGLITIGCCSNPKKICMYNTGTAPLNVKSVKLDPNCPSKLEFKITDVPPLPSEVLQGSPLCFKVIYMPQDLGKDDCNILIESSDQDQPEFTVPLHGEGTYETEQTDIFTQISGQSVDILFVVDDSGSMSEEQDNLAANISSFTQMAEQWNNDYQVGVINIGISKDCEWTGKLQGNPRIMTKNSISNFGNVVKNIKGCSSDYQEAGLEAAHIALTLPLIHDTDKACSSDSDCTAPDICVDGFCGGWNRGFLREDAALEIVIISDEEDQSPGTVDFYIDFFNSIKGFANQNLFHLHSIVGDAEKGCSSSFGEADAGNRYIEVSNATGGIVASICDQDYATPLKKIGEVAFGLKKQFFLTRDPDPSTIKVWVNGNLCASGQGYVYDMPSNSIIFMENGTCMPQPGDEIKVWYKTVCNSCEF